MERFAKEEEASQFVLERRAAAQPVRDAVQKYFCDMAARYEGFQWSLWTGSPTSAFARLQRDLHPESLNFRPTYNLTSRFTQRASVATSPTRIEVECHPGERDTTPMGAMTAQTIEDMAQTMVKHARLGSAWDTANFMRSVFGSYCVGLELRPSTSSSGPDCVISACASNPLTLALDPYFEERDLGLHDEVLISAAWSLNKIKRRLGPMLAAAGLSDLKPEDVSRFADLCNFEIEVAQYTGDALFGQYRRNSDTPAAMVHELYRKDDSGRFTQYSVLVEIARRSDKNGMVLLNPEQQTSPWGGIGLPLVLIHGHRRAEGGGPFGIGEVAMQSDMQDRVNRLNRWRELQEKHASKHMIVVDENGMGQDKSYAAIARRFTNAIGGIVVYNSGHQQRPAEAPRIQSVPSPNSHFSAEVQEAERGMREQVHRAAIHQGEVKSHVGLGQTEIAREEASQVLDKRVHDDLEAMSGLITTGSMTMVKLVRQGSAATIRLLQQAGFDAMDLGTIAGVDPTYPPVEITVRKGSIRMRSAASRKSDLQQAATLQAITPAELRRELASETMDMALTREDRFYTQAFAKLAADLVTGAMPAWEPIPLGTRAVDMIEVFTQSMLSRSTPPEAKQRLAAAIEAQRMYEAQAAAMLQPAQPAGQAQAPSQPEPAVGTVDDLVAQLSPQLNKAA